MNNSKEVDILEIDQEETNKNLAIYLGITYDELIQLDLRIETEYTSNGDRICFYNILISKSAPFKIIRKIIGVHYSDGEYYIEVSPLFFE